MRHTPENPRPPNVPAPAPCPSRRHVSSKGSGNGFRCFKNPKARADAARDFTLEATEGLPGDGDSIEAFMQSQAAEESKTEPPLTTLFNRLYDKSVDEDGFRHQPWQGGRRTSSPGLGR